MLYKSTVTSKGQMTLPHEIRKALDIKQGDLITIKVQSLTNKRLTLEAAGVTKTIGKLFGALGDENTEYIPLEKVRKITGKKVGGRYQVP